MNRSVFWTTILLLTLASVKTSEADTIDNVDFSEFKSETSNESSKIWDYKKYTLKSESIIVCEFIGNKTNYSNSLSSDNCVHFRAVKYIKGPQFAVRDLPIKYNYKRDDKTNDKLTKIKNSNLPKMGSLWIIFIENAIPKDGLFETYNGTLGRVPYNKQNYDLVMNVIAPYRKIHEYPTKTKS